MTHAYVLGKKIVHLLQTAGFEAVFIGGWVRDFLLQQPCDDIDIATSASPTQIEELFPESVSVGKAFGVIRVCIENYWFEVASFRSDYRYDGRHPESVQLGVSLQEDVKRRDFTINGMAYDPISETLLDFVGGQTDLQQRIIRTIGNPIERFEEDRLRILRAIRFKNTLHYSMDQATWDAICTYQDITPYVSSERIWQECSKMVKKSIFAACCEDMERSGLLTSLFGHGEKDIAALYSYRGSSCSGACCLLLHNDITLKLLHKYHLSHVEALVIEAFIQAQVLDNTPHASHIEYVYLYSLPQIDLALEALGCLHEPLWLQQHIQRQKRLSFWVEQVQHNRFLVSGADLQTLGIPPGKELGRYIKALFEFSITHNIQDKAPLLAHLHTIRGL